MKRCGLIVGCVVLLAVACSQLRAAEVADVIPDDVLLAVTVKDMNALHEKISDLAGKVADGAGEGLPDFLDLLLEQMELQAQVVRTAPDGKQTLEKLPTTIDRKRPFAFVIVNPGKEHKPENMMLFMIPITDYAKFLKEVAEVKSTPEDHRTPGQSVDGFDLIGDDVAGKGMYFAKRGDYAAVAASGTALKAFNAGKGTLAQVLNDQSRKVFAESDVAVFANCDQVLTTFQTEIDGALQQIQVQMDAKKANEAGKPADVQNFDAAKIAKAEMDLAIEIAKQADSCVEGVTFTKDEIRATCLLTPLPKTMLAEVLAAQKSGPLKVMAMMDKDAWLAASFYHAPNSTKVLMDRIVKFMTDSGLGAMFKNIKLEDYAAQMKELDGLYTGDISFAMYPAKAPENGVLNAVEVIECKDPDRVRTIMRKEMADQLAAGKTGMEGMDVDIKLTENAEPGIDRVTMEFKAKGEQPDPAMAQAMKMIKLMYGEKMTLYFTSVGKNYVVMTMGDQTTETVKAVAARLTAGTAGTLTTSAAFTSAFAGLPNERNGFCFISVPGMVKAIVPIVTSTMGADAPKFTMPPEAEQSGVGATFSFSGGIVRCDARVPVKEIVNVRKMFESAQPPKK